MRDDTAFRSQEFANQVEGRRDRIAEQQIALNQQAGQLPMQALQFGAAWNEMRDRHQKMMDDQRADAVNLATDQLRNQQAAEDLAWAQQIHSARMSKNLVERDNADTQLAVARANFERDKISGRTPERTDYESMLSAIASGIKYEMDPEKRIMTMSKTPATEDERANAIQQLLAFRAQSRGTRSRSQQIADLARAASFLDENGMTEDADAVKGEIYGLLGKAPPAPKVAAKPVSAAPQPEQGPIPAQWLNPNIGQKNSKALMDVATANYEILAAAMHDAMKIGGKEGPLTREQVMAWAAAAARDPKSNMGAALMTLARTQGLINENEILQTSPTYGGFSLPHVRQ